jgi:Nuclease-related domain
MKQNSRSPLTDKPLRNPGQSLERQRDGILYEKILFPALMAWFLICFIAWEWWNYFHPAPRNPIILTVMVIIAVVYIGYRISRMWSEVKQINQGIEGEKAVGQYLEKLREKGYQVFHDLIGANFNVDHVIIGPAGVFTVETKTISKPLRGQTKIQFDGETVQISGKDMDRILS